MADETLETLIGELAEANGIDPDYLADCLSSGDMPESLRETVTAALGDVDLFDQALKRKDD